MNTHIHLQNFDLISLYLIFRYFFLDLPGAGTLSHHRHCYRRGVGSIIGHRRHRLHKLGSKVLLSHILLTWYFHEQLIIILLFVSAPRRSGLEKVIKTLAPHKATKLMPSFGWLIDWIMFYAVSARFLVI